MKLITFRNLSIAIMLAVLSACNQSANQKQPEQTKTELTTVQIGYSKLRISLPIFVAQEDSIFKKHGIKAELLPYETAQPLMQGMVEGKVDVAGYTALPITYTGMIKSGKQLYFVSAMMEDQNHRISYLLRPKTAEGATPKIKTIKDLKGKKIGILPTIAYKGWLEEILRKNGLDPAKDVTIQQIEPLQQGATLKSKGVDALFTNDPVATATMLAGVSELITDSVECPQFIMNPFPFGSFNVSKEWADKNPDAFKNLVAALNEAIDSTNANPAKAKMAMQKYLPPTFKDHVLKYPDALYLKSSETNEELFNNAAAVYLKLGIIPGEIKLNGLVTK